MSDRVAMRQAGQATAVDLIDAQVRDVVRREGIDPLRNPGAVRSILTTVVREYDERSLTGNVPPLEDAEAVRREVLDRVAGFGPLQRYLDDPEVESACQVVAYPHDSLRRGVRPSVAAPGWQLRRRRPAGALGPGLRRVSLA